MDDVETSIRLLKTAFEREEIECAKFEVAVDRVLRDPDAAAIWRKPVTLGGLADEPPVLLRPGGMRPSIELGGSTVSGRDLAQAILD